MESQKKKKKTLEDILSQVVPRDESKTHVISRCTVTDHPRRTLIPHVNNQTKYSEDPSRSL